MKWGEAMNDRQYKVEQLMEYGKSLLSTKITSLVPRFPHYYVLTFANAHWAALFICDQNYYANATREKVALFHLVCCAVWWGDISPYHRI